MTAPRKKRWRKAPGRAGVTLRPFERPPEWPDPPMVPSFVLRRCERAGTIEEVRAIVQQFLPVRPPT